MCEWAHTQSHTRTPSHKYLFANVKCNKRWYHSIVIQQFVAVSNYAAADNKIYDWMTKGLAWRSLLWTSNPQNRPTLGLHLCFLKAKKQKQEPKKGWQSRSYDYSTAVESFLSGLLEITVRHTFSVASVFFSFPFFWFVFKVENM